MDYALTAEAQHNFYTMNTNSRARHHGSALIIDQNRTLYKQLPIILSINIPLVAALAWIYWPWLNQHWLVAWCGGMFMIVLLRFYFYLTVYKNIPRDQLQAWQMKLFAANSALSGVMWGLAGMLFFVPDRLEYQLVIFLVLILKGAGSVSAVTSYLPAFYAYFPASMLPVCVMFFLQGSTNSILLGLTGLVYTVVLMVFGKNLNKTLLESLRLRDKNQHLLEEALAQKHQAEQANLAKSRFLAAASHDLRQPIYALGLFNAVLEETVTNAKTAKVVTQISNTIDTLQNLLDALLDISRLDAGVVNINKQYFDLKAVFARLANDFTPQAQEKGLHIHWPEESLAVYSDENLLEQVLRNLVSNAIRYTASGSVEIKAAATGERVRIEVIDTGIGIAADQQREIFSEFYQVGNPQRDRRQGLGLGLAIVDRVLKLLGSAIELQSSPGKGSRFYFDVRKGDLDKIATEPHKSMAASPQKITSTIAVVEDDVEVAHAMRLLLESWGCTTIVTADADAMLEKLQQGNAIPDMIISDLQLTNGQSGINAIQRIRNQAGRSLPALIISGKSDAQYLEDVKQLGIPMLHKPVSPAKLRAFLRNML